MKYKVYVIKSLKEKHFYIGCTSDLSKRIEEHNKGRTKSTRPYLPWVVIYHETFTNKSMAYKREWYLKHPKGYIEKIEIIKKYGGVA